MIGRAFTIKPHTRLTDGLVDGRGRPFAFHFCKADDTVIALQKWGLQAFLADKDYDARVIANRYDQLAESFLSMVDIASARYWLKHWLKFAGAA
jgi:hypothetical protein